MTDVNAKIRKIRAMGGKAKAARKAAEAEREARNREEATLCNRIATGKDTTGDRIRDFVIAKYGISPDGNVLKNYRYLDSAVQAHPGEFILMVTKREESRFHGGPDHVPQPHDYGIDETLYLGVLGKRPLLLNLKDRVCALPTTRYVRCWSVQHESTELVQGPMAPERMRDFGLSLNKLLRCHEPGTHYELEVTVGDAEVLAWFESRNEWLICAGNELHLWVFRKMAKLLKRPTPPSKALDALLNERQTAVSLKLIALVARRNALRHEIAEATKKHRGPDKSELERTLWQPRRDLNRVLDELRAVLTSTLDLDMGDATLRTIPSLRREFGVRKRSS